MSGDLIGTLRYTSPEHALAKRVAIDRHAGPEPGDGLPGASAALCQGVPPPEPGEPREVRIVRVEFALVLDRQRREVCVGGEVAADAKGAQQTLQHVEVAGPRLEHHDARTFEPLAHVSNSCSRIQWRDQHRRVGHEPNESEAYRPR